MKKFLLLLTLFVVLSNCEISPRKAKAYSNTTDWYYHEETKDGMKYGIWTGWYGEDPSNREDGLVVVNLTKEALEVEMLKLQIEKLKNEKNKP